MIMYIYLIILIFFAINFEKYKKIKYLDIVIFGFLFLLVSFRYRTGGDFRPYINAFDDSITLDYEKPYDLFGYINLFSRVSGLDLFGVNLILGFIFFSILYVFFIKYFRNIYLALVIAYPIFINIYAIGSLRQGLAIIFFLASLLFLNYKVKLIAIFLSITFHFSALLYLFIYISQSLFKKGLSKYPLIVLLLVITFLLKEKFINYYTYYIAQDAFNSPGFFYRNFITYICSIIFIKWFLEKKSFISDNISYIFLIISILSLIIFSFGIIFQTHYSTSADRIMGYFFPLQIYVVYFIYEISAKKNKQKINALICTYSFLMFYVWDMFGNNSHAWSYELFFLPIKYWSFN